MATPRDFIKAAMRLLQVYSIGEVPTADEEDTGMSALNRMLDSWSVNGMMIYVPTLDTIALAANQQTVTVGPSGSVVTPRPIEVLASTNVTLNGVNYPVALSSLRDFNAIPVAVAGIPNTIYVLAGMPDITLNLWPYPSSAMTLNLWSQKQLQSFATVTDTVLLPPGYERAIVHSLAEEIASEFECDVPPQVARIAAQSRKVIKRSNLEIPTLQMPRGVPVGRAYIGINS